MCDNSLRVVKLTHPMNYERMIVFKNTAVSQHPASPEQYAICLERLMTFYSFLQLDVDGGH